MDDSLTVVFNNSEMEDYQGYHFESLLYGVMDENPGADVFYDVDPTSDPRKSQIEAYMTEAFEEGLIYGGIHDYGGAPLLRTAKVLADPDIEVGAFDAGPVRLEEDMLEGGYEGQEVPDDISEDFRRGDSVHQRANSDESFADYVIENAVSLGDTVVIKEAPTSVVTELEDLDVRVHRANDQLVSQKQLKKMSSFGSEYTELQERSQDF